MQLAWDVSGGQDFGRLPLLYSLSNVPMPWRLTAASSCLSAPPLSVPILQAVADVEGDDGQTPFTLQTRQPWADKAQGSAIPTEEQTAWLLAQGVSEEDKPGKQVRFGMAVEPAGGQGHVAWPCQAESAQAVDLS